MPLATNDGRIFITGMERKSYFSTTQMYWSVPSIAMIRAPSFHSLIVELQKWWGRARGDSSTSMCLGIYLQSWWKSSSQQAMLP